MASHLDHLVIAAADLDSGARWCEETFGIRPLAGGAHPLMGTHNLLVRLEGDQFERAYLEIIAIDPSVVPERPPPLARWFDLDHPSLASRLREEGPQLVHWVVRTDDVRAAVAAWTALGIHRGTALAASRMSPAGRLTWHITVRDDGARLFDGCLPTLIEWGPVHPAPALAEQGLKLEAVSVSHPEASLLAQAFAAVAMDGVHLVAGPAALQARFSDPGGHSITLSSAAPSPESPYTESPCPEGLHPRGP